MYPTQPERPATLLALLYCTLGLLVFTTSVQADLESPAAAEYAPPGHEQPANVPGGVALVQRPGPETTVSFAGREAMYINNMAIVAIPVDTKPGSHSIQLQTGDTVTEQQFEVRDKQYTEQHITIKNQALVDPPAETLARIREESARQRKLYRNYRRDNELSDGFLLPLQGITTSLFGHRRFFNGQPRSPHSGLDIAADTGTPIVAAGNGIVTLADDLYFNGNTVFIDHGQGLVTMYCHMSAINVVEGEAVKQGDTIGLVGATGRATGPHLHWSVSLGGYRIDPEVFLRELNQLVTN